MFSIRKVLVIAACILAGGVFIGSEILVAQGLTNVLSGSKSSKPTSPSASDPLDRTTPRNSIFHFLEACHDNNFRRASLYLDLRRIKPEDRAAQGPELAKQLGALLDYDPHFEVENLNNTPEGDLADSLAPDQEALDTFEANGRSVPLLMQRVPQNGTNVWLVSADSVERIPELSVLVRESAFEKKLPTPLVTTKLLDTPVWVWLALVLLALLLSVISRVLSKIVIAFSKPLMKRHSTWFQARRLEEFTEPLRLLLSVAVFKVCMEVIAPSALLRYYLDRLVTLLFFVGAAAFLMRVVDVISDRVISRFDPRERALSYSVLPLFVRMVKICIFCVAVVLTLAQWGYNTNAILAGLGVGGLAVALAAQKTIENLFGGVAVITDRPVLVGDLCQFGGQLGTVEDIGLRSTRIRTLDRTVVTVPNSQFSTMTLENYSRRDRLWFHPTLQLRRDTTPEQIEEVMKAIGRILEEHPKVDASGVPVRFTKISPQWFDLEIFAYVLTTDYDEFVRTQSELLLKFLETASALGVGFAVPIQEAATVPRGLREAKEFEEVRR
ncbi:MAG: mechanosensitive ion channel family protein [Acidobacteriaceae bacterium]|nr:mechanosensitive ion channel family protein [Acidobacteriaceae bacterium]MBV9778817.1 mechanosensitive ion channel family protein [Acidobacteriaceae bacterium]